MRITDNFTLEELYASDTAKKKRINNEPDDNVKHNLIELCNKILQPIRDRFGQPITVNSGYRSQTLNKAVGGSRTSQHLTGEAADITGKNNKELWKLINSMIESGELEVGQLIDESNLKWIHISLPNNKHRNQILKL